MKKKSEHKQLKVIAKGLWVGSTMTVPGVSGGTMAVVAGIYEDLLHSVNQLRREPLRQIPFLLQFVLGAGTGFLLLAGIITRLLQNEMTGEAVRLLFFGIVAGGIPLLVQKAEVKKFSVRHVLYLLCGAGIVWGLAGIPQGTFLNADGWMGILLQVLGGVLIAVALILPGISVTHMLYILGMYEVVLEYVYHFQILKLVPLVAGGLLGTFFTTGMLEHMLKRYKEAVYLVIIGFVAGSLISLLPPGGIHTPLVDLFVCVAGFFAMYRISRYA